MRFGKDAIRGPATHPMHLIQCVPNFSEGRDAAVIGALANAIRETPGVALVDHSADYDHHRSVFTFLGTAFAVAAASLAAARIAVAAIDLNRHSGVHPRMGALDVLPFVPVGDTPMECCIDLARQVGETLGAELGLPVYLYEEAASRPERQSLAWVRAGGFEALRDRSLSGEYQPDFGPAAVHPTAGAAAVGARGPLVAYNVVLRTGDLEIARAVARRVRERDGGLVGIRALGLPLSATDTTQVSLNITQPAKVPLYRIFELVRLEAARYGVTVIGSELIGALRIEELAEVARYYLGLNDLKASQVLDLWVAAQQGYPPASGEGPTDSPRTGEK